MTATSGHLDQMLAAGFSADSLYRDLVAAIRALAHQTGELAKAVAPLSRVVELLGERERGEPMSTFGIVFAASLGLRWHPTYAPGRKVAGAAMICTHIARLSPAICRRAKRAA